MTGDTGLAFDLQDALGRDAIVFPLRDGLRRHANQVCKLPLRTSLREQVNRIAHDFGRYTGSLEMSTYGLLSVMGSRVERQPMVDRSPKTTAEKRPYAAEHPAIFDSFTAWLRSATRLHGFQVRLAEYCAVEPQNIQKWLKGSIPDDPAVRRRIAEWAGVDDGALRDLIDKTVEARSSPKRGRAKGIAPSRIPAHSES